MVSLGSLPLNTCWQQFFVPVFYTLNYECLESSMVKWLVMYLVSESEVLFQAGKEKEPSMVVVKFTRVGAS